MKFLIVASIPESIIRFRLSLITSLQERGFEVHVAAPDVFLASDYREDFLNLESTGVRLHQIRLHRRGLNPLSDARALFDLLAVLFQIRPKYILTYTIKPVIYGSFCAFLARVPNRISLITGLGVAFTDGAKGKLSPLTRILIAKLYALALKVSSKIIFQNDDDRSLFTSLGIIGRGQETYLINGSGVDLREYSSAEPRMEHNFLIISRLIASKGIREFVAAARIIKTRYPNVVFTVVGYIDEGKDSIDAKELNAWIEDGLINFLGELKDVRPAIRNSSVYVLPSYREGTPRSVLEAMAMGRPIITTDAPGCRETVDFTNGFLVPVGDVDALVGAMCAFIDNPELIKEMGLASLDIVQRKYDVNTVTSDLLNCMDIL